MIELVRFSSSLQLTNCVSPHYYLLQHLKTCNPIPNAFEKERFTRSLFLSFGYVCIFFFHFSSTYSLADDTSTTDIAQCPRIYSIHCWNNRMVTDQMEEKIHNMKKNKRNVISIPAHWIHVFCWTQHHSNNSIWNFLCGSPVVLTHIYPPEFLTQKSETFLLSLCVIFRAFGVSSPIIFCLSYLLSTAYISVIYFKIQRDMLCEFLWPTNIFYWLPFRVCFFLT